VSFVFGRDAIKNADEDVKGDIPSHKEYGVSRFSIFMSKKMQSHQVEAQTSPSILANFSGHVLHKMQKKNCKIHNV